MANRLEADRPVPAAGFRGALRRSLAGQDPGYGTRPAQPRLIASAYLAVSLVLLAVAALLASGSL